MEIIVWQPFKCPCKHITGNIYVCVDKPTDIKFYIGSVQRIDSVYYAHGKGEFISADPYMTGTVAKGKIIQGTIADNNYISIGEYDEELDLTGYNCILYSWGGIKISSFFNSVPVNVKAYDLVGNLCNFQKNDGIYILYNRRKICVGNRINMA